MQIVRNKTTKVAYYIFGDNDWVTVTDILLSKNFKALDINSTTHEIVNGDMPDLFAGGAMTYDDGWVIVNQESYDEAFFREKEKYKSRVKEKFTSYLINPIVKTGLGFSVDGGYNKIKDFEIGKKHNFPQVRDSDNNYHNVVADDYDVIINAIEQFGIDKLAWKWEKESEIENCNTIVELKNLGVQDECT